MYYTINAILEEHTIAFNLDLRNQDYLYVIAIIAGRELSRYNALLAY